LDTVDISCRKVAGRDMKKAPIEIIGAL